MELFENHIKGYCLMSLVSAGLRPEQIRGVMNELKVILDLVSPEEARKKYETSPY
jgi:hypothetical protein